MLGFSRSPLLQVEKSPCLNIIHSAVRVCYGKVPVIEMGRQTCLFSVCAFNGPLEIFGRRVTFHTFVGIIYLGIRRTWDHWHILF